MPPRVNPARAAKSNGKMPHNNGKRKKDDANGSSGKKKAKTAIPQILNEEALVADINTDYSKKRKNLRPQKMLKKQQWGKVKDIITERENAPKGWNSDEPDLMSDDFESQIDRCVERIADNIMPHVYQRKMNEFMARQGERDTLMAAEPGLSWPVVQRLEDLKLTLAWLEEGKDVHKMVDTVKAIMAQYRAGGLDWHPDFVTYWHAGVQLCLPRPFHWDEYRYIHDKSQGHEGFWVEGILGPGPGLSKTSMVCQPDPHLNATMVAIPISIALFVRLSLRIPQVPQVPPPAVGNPLPPKPPCCEFSFMDDTGSTHMSIFEEDIAELQVDPRTGHKFSIPRCLGVGVLYVADGRRIPSLFREFEVNMWSEDESGWMASEWEAIPASIRPGGSTRAGHDRLSGSWLRHRFYTGTTPDQSMRLWVFSYNPGIPPHGQRTLPTATTAQLTAPFRTGRLYPVTDFPHLDPTLATGQSLI
ncbi:hypothetical protein N7445_001488 [Penicillium cf. griseofulvum]|nr:hypothetical protein N7445_001488 [Penicillium cf. griseofulvum]